MYHMAAMVIRTVTTPTTSLMILFFVVEDAEERNKDTVIHMVKTLQVALVSNKVPMYTVMNCFGIERAAASMKTKMFMPHTANNAVVTRQT
jgi:hypothetical protein